MQRGEPTVPGADTDLAILFKVRQKNNHLLSCQLGKGDVGYPALCALGDKAQKESPRIPVGQDGMARDVTLANQPVVEVSMEGGVSKVEMVAPIALT